MHSFHPSRGRILFEVLCALGVVVSCVGAWKQTGASALLVAAAAAGLYGFVHLFDLLRRDPTGAEEPQRIEFDPDEAEPSLLSTAPVVKLEAVVKAEAVAPRASKGSKAKTPRKGGARRVTASKQAKASAAALVEAEEVSEHLPLEEVEALVHHEEAAHAPIEPLFMTEPLGRPHRAVFGRKAG